VATGTVRENYVKSYRFTQLTADGYVQIGITIRFNVKNYSDKTIEYRPSIQEEIFYSPEFDYMEYGPIGTPKVLTQAQIQELAYDDPQTHVKNLLAPAIDLPPMKKDQPNPQFQVVIKYRVRMREQYSDVTNFGGATLGAKIELDEIPDTLTFVSGGDETLQHVPDSKTWYFDRPFINGQNVRVWWFRR